MNEKQIPQVPNNSPGDKVSGYDSCGEGVEIYRRTVSFLLSAAIRRALPDRGEYLYHSIDCAYYYTFTRSPKVCEDEINILKTEMRRLIAEDLEISCRYIDYREALDYFERNGLESTALLLRQRGRARVKVNQLGGFVRLYAAPLLHSTGDVSVFDISAYHEGFLLRFPPYRGSGTLQKFTESPKIFSAYNEYKKWGRIIGVHSAGHINELIADGTIKEFIRMNEAFQDKKLSAIADEIYECRNDVKLVLIAGPSSSGKTTTAKRLAIHLKVLGIEPVAISLDDYYLHPDNAPKDENGQPDLECLEALDVDYLNRQLLDLFDGKDVTLPVFDFKTCTRKEGETIRLGKRREVLVIEGIHGLNDALTHQIKNENKFKIFVSVLTQIIVDDQNPVNPCDNRLLRRIVRDNRFRGASVLRTLSTWDSVQKGAEKHIFRFENSADAVFNSALDYEIPVLKCYTERLLRGVKPENTSYDEATRLLDFFDNFNILPPQAVPADSLLREFIGESGFKY
ncbi:MAG: nucleoside kinase [Spirochaetaceae bacterium]|jgi:uridine kinase|nr:nucleoside kinase [Spirochaetaceae bacterium]